ncbi:come operon protein 4 [Triangularia verruculosa]|uniref:Come operon protein 4 n=1 Tax=Triangularia verruculosa TaxID=2587418 RepID=A0AAN6X640_9PEZI|nr:come operon protein 4 [Triangularia verruculosa]
MAQTRITSIGIGNMGAALAGALLKNNTSVTIWNRTADRPLVKDLISAGAIFEPSVATAIGRSNIILFCLFDYPIISEALKGVDADGGAQPFAGKTIINLTNGTPAQARELETYLRRLGAAAYFDGAIMVPPQLVGTPSAFVILGGETEARYTQLDIPGVLAPVAKTVQYVAEDAGAASLLDCAALAAMYGMFSGAFTGFGLLQRQRGTRLTKKAVDSVMIPMLNALVPYVGSLSEQVDEMRWMDSLGNPLAMQAAGVRNIMQSCEEEGVDGSALKWLVDKMEMGVKEGYSEGGVAVVGKYMLK